RRSWGYLLNAIVEEKASLGKPRYKLSVDVLAMTDADHRRIGPDVPPVTRGLKDKGDDFGRRSRDERQSISWSSDPSPRPSRRRHRAGDRRRHPRRARRSRSHLRARPDL